MLINEFERYQRGLKTMHLYPKIDGVCACGCGQELTGRQKKWASKECNDIAYINTAIIKGNVTLIRSLLFNLDQGICRFCDKYDSEWQADHIVPVFKGGSACGLDNFQTLCHSCHSLKTYIQSHTESHLAYISSHDAIRESNVLLYAAGALL